MKKTILKILVWMTRIGGGIGIGWFFGTIAGKLLGLLVDEEFAENHPWITLVLWLAATAVASGATLLVVTYPLTWVCDWFDKKVDDIEDDPFEES